MKTIIYPLSLLLLCSCNFKKLKSESNNLESEKQISGKTIDLKNIENYFKIPLNDYNLYIGEMYSVNENLSEDYKIQYKNDTIWIFKNFLESDTFDGKNIIFDKNISPENVNVKYVISYFFNGTEKANQYIDTDISLSYKLVDFVFPHFEEVKKDSLLTKKIAEKQPQITEKIYTNYIDYYNQFSENELKNCCPSDFQDFNKLKKIDKKNIKNIDIEEDLKTYLAYSSIILELTDDKKSKVIVFSNKPNE